MRFSSPIAARMTLGLLLSWAALSLASCSEEKSASAASGSEKVYPVTLAIVQPAATSKTITAAGTVRYRYETPLGFTSAGKIASIRFEEGDRVVPGALIAALDATQVNSGLESARAEQQRAQAELGRFQQLFEKGWVTRAQLERSEAAARAATAQVSNAGFASGTSRIVAPSGGIILARTAEPGQVVAAGTQIVVLGETSGGMVLRAPMIDSDIGRLTPGMPAQVTLSGLAEGVIEGTISEIDARANPTSGAFEVTVALPANPGLRSGQIGTVQFRVAAQPQDTGLAIPASAVFNVRAGEGFVYLLDAKASRVRARAVQIGRIDDRQLVITGGLKPGDRIVASGLGLLVDGARVKPLATRQPSRTRQPAPAPMTAR
ncbi:efflux RND transporter periplasmic adaptor subunit [Blastomonas fulva]|uniref:efflux RND transporter periplasmic adaptor subunit n=1 Tax=Blastomonas fulva TaxID=1550728 RepID=UPI0025A4380E|nr:efflux RND transporter periplasmic adaptor subunit [Blastomonas fulva]MDM7927921.1 efflux RND transporter periplasmic adaptor subunit [Blastomonas fulva]MDM7965789.1 efflux RND transporter periplasmic adaptor subunit [Blastomonas fulva]